MIPKKNISKFHKIITIILIINKFSQKAYLSYSLIHILHILFFKQIKTQNTFLQGYNVIILIFRIN